VTRIRISEIWKRRPEFTGRQVIEKLGTEHRVRLPWVQKILSDCWKASARHNAEQQRIGRRNVRSSRRCEGTSDVIAPHWSNRKVAIAKVSGYVKLTLMAAFTRRSLPTGPEC
jgi:hypothetical protein